MPRSDIIFRVIGIAVRVLGGFDAVYQGTAVPALAAGRLQSLLAYLLLNAGTSISRQQLAGILWPDSAESQARTNLRQLLHNLRTAWPDVDRYLDGDSQVLRWPVTANWSLDAAEFDAAALRGETAHRQQQIAEARSALERAVVLYSGDLLPGVYDEWVEGPREKLRQRHLGALELLITILEQQRDYTAAITVAGRLLTTDPLRESAYQAAMRLHAVNGDRAAALAIYDRCAAMLQRELGVAPDDTTRRLRDQIASASAAPAEPAPSKQHAFVGRQQEWSVLQEAGRSAAAGRPTFILIQGEPGIGKTRLLEEFLVHAGRQGATIARAACYNAETTMSFAPVSDWLRGASIQPALRSLAAPQLSHLARVLPEILSAHPEVGTPPPFTDAWQQRHFYEALAVALLRSPQPLVLSIDDLQWCDTETLEWLPYLLRFEAASRLLIAATARADHLAGKHPASVLLRELMRTGQAVDLHLGPLSAGETSSLASSLVRQELGRDAAAALYERTRGNPLFIVETVRAGLTAPDAETAMLPPKVHAVISARLAQLADPVHHIANAAAAIGRPFTSTLLALATGTGEEEIAQALDDLWHRRILDSDGRDLYDFSHGQIREVAYNELGPARRRLLHRRIAEVLEAQHAVNPDAVSAQIAGHYERAGLAAKAIPYYRRAADVVRRRYAEEDAIALLSRALALVSELPQTPELDRAELSMLATLSEALIATRGYAAPEVGKACARARMLSEVTGESRPYFPVLAASYCYHIVCGELDVSREIAKRYHVLAERQTDPLYMAGGHYAMGGILFHNGAYNESLGHLENCVRCMEDYDGPLFCDFGPETGVFGRSYLAHVLWMMGREQESMAEAHRAIARAEALHHPFSQAVALAYTAMLHQFRGEPEPAERRADEAAALCQKYGFRYYLAWTPILRGWSHACRGMASGLQEMQEGFDALRATNAKLRGPYYLSLMADACLQTGQLEQGRAFLTEAYAMGQETREAWVKPELERLNGNLILAGGGDPGEARARYREAIRLAHEQQAKSFESRAQNALNQIPATTRRGHSAHI
jgi:DNA-binding SARP family transcriptional activator